MFDKIIEKIWVSKLIPAYSFLKIGFLVFLMHPRTQGAELVYTHVLLPFLQGHHTEITALKAELLNRIAQWRKLDYAKMAKDLLKEAQGWT